MYEIVQWRVREKNAIVHCFIACCVRVYKHEHRESAFTCIVFPHPLFLSSLSSTFLRPSLSYSSLINLSLAFVCLELLYMCKCKSRYCCDYRKMPPNEDCVQSPPFLPAAFAFWCNKCDVVHYAVCESNCTSSYVTSLRQSGTSRCVTRSRNTLIMKYCCVLELCSFVVPKHVQQIEQKICHNHR